MIKVDLSQIVDLPREFAERVSKGVDVALLAMEAQMVKEAPHRSGNLVGAIVRQRTDGGGEVIVSGAAPYAVYVHEGTGIWGPGKKPIKPVQKRALAWAGAGGMVVRRAVKGQPPNRFADRAEAAARPVVERIFEELKP